MTKALLSFLVAMIMIETAHAQLGGADTKPGDPCSTAEEGYIRRNASADRDVSEITLICDGSQWQSAQLAPGLPSLNSSQIWVGNGSNAATAVAMSGDATLSNAGVLNIANDALLGPEISSGSITNSHLAGSIALSKLSVTGTADGSKFLRDDGSWQAVSGADNLGNHTATTTLNLNNNSITGASRIFMNSQTPYPDFWSSTGLIAGTSYGYLGTNGAHRTSLMWNGYRNSSDTWTSLGINSFTSAAGIELGNDGILFEAQATTPLGKGPATRMKINPTGEVGINKTAVYGRELDVAGEIYATEFFGSGSNLTALNASSLSSGTVAAARLGSGTANTTTFLRGDGSWQAPSETDPQVDAVTSDKWCRGTGSQVTCDQDAPNGGALAAPPVCNLSNRALQWDGTNWSCVIIAGSGGPPIVNGNHTQQECIDAGGTINTTEFGGDILCTVNGNGCPNGWTVYGAWKRNAKTCSGACSAPNWTCTLPAGWMTAIGSRSCSYNPTWATIYGCTSASTNTNCTQAAGEGVTNTACY